MRRAWRWLAARVAWDRLVFVVSVLAVAIAGVTYTNHVQREADHRWCELLVVLTGGPAPAPGPAGERARALGKLLVQLRDDLGC